MDEFDIYLESTGSMDTYHTNTMACFRNVLAEPLYLEGDWRVAIAEIIYPSSIKNVTTKDYFIYTPRTPYQLGVLEREDWSNNAIFPDGEYKRIADIVEHLNSVSIEIASESNRQKPIIQSNSDGEVVEFTFREGYGISVRDRTIFDVLGFKGIPDPNRGGYFIGSHRQVVSQLQPMKADYPPDITAGTNIFFVYCDIIEHQHIAGVKAPVLRVIDTRRRLKNGELQIISTTEHVSFRELQFKKLVLGSIKEIFIELVSASGSYIPFVGTGRVALTLKFRKF